MFSSRRSVLLSMLMAVAMVAAVLLTSTEAFSPSTRQVATGSSTTTTRTLFAPTPLNVFGGKNKKEKEDLSFIETRDMTREEMLDLNRQNEEIMNMELTAMTGFSLVLSLPILYLCWVAFFSD